MSKISVVGLDPSTSNFGIVKATVDIDSLEVTVVDMVLAKTEPETKKGVAKQSDDLRRAKIVRAAMIEHTKDAAVVISEIPFCNPGTYASANFNSGLVTGVLASCPLPVIQVSPQEVKIAAVNHRQAAKEEMIEWGIAKHPDANWRMRKLKGKMIPTKDNEHLADALAAIYAGIRSDQFLQLIGLLRSANTSSASA